MERKREYTCVKREKEIESVCRDRDAGVCREIEGEKERETVSVEREIERVCV